MKHKIDKAAQDFLATFMGDTAAEKTAVELEPETAEALGIPTVSPSMLDELESSAREPQQPDDDEPPAEEQVARPQAAPDEVAVFDGNDEEPAPDEEADESSAEPALPTRSTHGRLFGDKRAHPMDILKVLSTRYGDEWVDWEPATLWWAIRRDFGTVGQVTRDKIGALRTAVSTDLPWKDWDTFENCSLAWSDLVPLVGVFQPITPAQAAFGVSILQQIRADEPFQNEVNAYIAAILDDDGWAFAPPEYFAGAQALLDRKVWLAGLRHDVEQAWERIKDVDPTTIEWNHGSAVDVHLIKLMAVRHYVTERNAMRGRGIGSRTAASAAQPPVPQ